MLSTAISPLVDGGVPIQSAKSLSSDTNTGPQDRTFLQTHCLNHRADRVRGLAPRREANRKRWGHKSIINTASWAPESVMHVLQCFSAFLFKSCFLRVQIFTCFYLSKQNLYSQVELHIPIRRIVPDVHNRDRGCFCPIFLCAWFRQNCSALGSDLGSCWLPWVPKWFWKLPETIGTRSRGEAAVLAAGKFRVWAPGSSLYQSHSRWLCADGEKRLFPVGFCSIHQSSTRKWWAAFNQNSYSFTWQHISNF